MTPISIATAITGTSTHVPWTPVFVVLGIIVLALIVNALRRSAGSQRDPQRMFTVAQRREGFDRAGGRCEMNAGPFSRCRNPATHGDHHIPWTHGGASSMANYVAACAAHNLSKGAKHPTWWASYSIARRRRHYFTTGQPTQPGQRMAAIR